MSDETSVGLLEHTRDIDPTASLKKYDLKEVIGEGGAGKVYKAEAGGDTTVALKVSNDWVSNPAELEHTDEGVVRVHVPERHPLAGNATEGDKVRFIHGDNPNPNIVGIHEVGSAPKHAKDIDTREWSVLELAEEGSLAGLLHNEGMFTVAQTAHMGVQLADAIAATQAKGLVHADIKPANIYVKGMTDDGPDIVLGDFGIAGPPKQSNKAELTISYGAPEQFGGRKSFMSDVYSLGLVLYELETGEKFYNFHPDASPQLARLNYNRKQDEYDSFVRARLSKIAPKSPEMVALLEEMLALSEFDRPNIKIVKHELQQMHARYKEVNEELPKDRPVSSLASEKTMAGPPRKHTKVYTVHK